MALRVTPLGAAQQVGRSCILLEIGGRNVLLDCGVAAHSSGSYYPEFSLLGEVQSLDVVIITHFHLDHVGALPYLTEILGYHGPILMTHPTRAIGPIIIKDALAFRRDAEALTPEMVDAPFDRARCFQLQERVEIGDLSVTSFYAGHVLEAVMVHLECRGQSALYTGDFTMVSDYHLSAARVPLALHPDVMITETTCCTTIRSSKRREVNDLCSKVQDCLEKGGKVLVPLLVMGRSTEICMILEEHWAKAKLAYPIFVISAMAQKARVFFQTFASWGSKQVRSTDRPFAFPHVRFGTLSELLALSGPAVALAGSAMLDFGPSQELFKSWAPEKQNLIVIPGYCLPGTVGNLVQAKERKIELSSGIVHVRCEVDHFSISDHTDSRGIVELICQVAPRQVVLVHGGLQLMDTFTAIVRKRLRLPCHMPAVGDRVEIPSPAVVEAWASSLLMAQSETVPPPPVVGVPVIHAAAPVVTTFRGELRKRDRAAAGEALELHAAAHGPPTAKAKAKAKAKILIRQKGRLPCEALKAALRDSNQDVPEDLSSIFEVAGATILVDQIQAGTAAVTISWVAGLEDRELLAQYRKDHGHDPADVAARRTLKPMPTKAQLRQFAQHRGHNLPFRAAQRVTDAVSRAWIRIEFSLQLQPTGLSCLKMLILLPGLDSRLMWQQLCDTTSVP
ncbi:Integrator complex subunit 11 [Symbiodinium microadriaticum]|uniref:Integrator complex subunit 11 n=1 Tax=Symbiodinium microadriaticum TaxID=2951 RepID=A0A1Q9CFK9_SYMMI|nr:Integrator complex subunit 11 [Symbiodinium microadriaticum]